MSDSTSRQGFLGPNSPAQIASTRIAVVGLGGGGSHVVQQFAHVGFRVFALFDDDCVEGTNLNRLVGATKVDAEVAASKMGVAVRAIRGLVPDARIDQQPRLWQEAVEHLRRCDIVVGCLDGFSQRAQLEACARRYLLPYVDIGLDVHGDHEVAPLMAGQVIVSMPGGPCMRCLGFLNDEALAREAAAYGAAGQRAQVVWGNGVLASIAVGLVVDLVTGWTRRDVLPVYLSYDANAGTVVPHPRAAFAPSGCPHYPGGQIGDAVYFDPRRVSAAAEQVSPFPSMSK